MLYFGNKYRGMLTHPNKIVWISSKPRILLETLLMKINSPWQCFFKQMAPKSIHSRTKNKKFFFQRVKAKYNKVQLTKCKANERMEMTIYFVTQGDNSSLFKALFLLLILKIFLFHVILLRLLHCRIYSRTHLRQQQIQGKPKIPLHFLDEKVKWNKLHGKF